MDDAYARSALHSTGGQSPLQSTRRQCADNERQRVPLRGGLVREVRETHWHPALLRRLPYRRRHLNKSWIAPACCRCFRRGEWAGRSHAASCASSYATAHADTVNLPTIGAAATAMASATTTAVPSSSTAATPFIPLSAIATSQCACAIEHLQAAATAVDADSAREAHQHADWQRFLRRALVPHWTRCLPTMHRGGGADTVALPQWHATATPALPPYPEDGRQLHRVRHRRAPHGGRSALDKLRAHAQCVGRPRRRMPSGVHLQWHGAQGRRERPRSLWVSERTASHISAAVPARSRCKRCSERMCTLSVL